MRRTVLLPAWAESPSPAVEAPPSAYATVTHKSGFDHVRFAGATAPGADGLADQVRRVLERRERALGDLGGGLADVVMTRYFVREDHFSREAQARIHEVRDDLFDRPDVPASTMIAVADLFDDALVEVEIEAEIPADGWQTTAETGEADST